IAIIGGTASEDANWVFIVNDDGTATVLNTLRSQDINGHRKSLQISQVLQWRRIIQAQQRVR
ncbi:MAG: hypothetical protein R3261_12670, partial [Alphaproteobacteria bacterium]|nr:hypothetical protein [Alphaproteobacteria bacterium]